MVLRQGRIGGYPDGGISTEKYIGDSAICDQEFGRGFHQVSLETDIIAPIGLPRAVDLYPPDRIADGSMEISERAGRFLNFTTHHWNYE
jgi:hypothetical protein